MNDVFYTLNILWIGFVVGACLGVFTQKRAMRQIMRIKAIDGTAEHLGNGEFIYMLSEKDYCRIVLGTPDSESTILNAKEGGK